MTTTLYGAEVSYFTGKVRAYLRWADIPFEEVLSTADVYRQIIVPSVGAPVPSSPSAGAPAVGADAARRTT